VFIVGDVVKLDDALVTLESDKATMDVPSTVAGVVRKSALQLGEKLSEGAVVVLEASIGQASPPLPRGERGVTVEARPPTTCR
jgi:pyruvate dehydrogenase E2 component (dihydrolipoamide acetyltransferase)